MKKISILLLSLFIITGCGDSSSGKKTTTRNGGRGLDRGGSGGSGGLGGSNCNFIDCSDNGSGNPVVGNTTATPFSVGRSNSSFYNMRVGLEYYVDGQSSAEAYGELEVVNTNYTPSFCRIPSGYYNLDTVTQGYVGNIADHQYTGIELEGTGQDNNIYFRARIINSQSNNRGDFWDLNARLELQSVEGRSCNQFGIPLILDFIFPF